MAKDKETKQTAEEPSVSETKSAPKVVRMERYIGGPPNEADVHPDEVENWKRAGWHIKG